jgi:hypothetical protein
MGVKANHMRAESDIERLMQQLSKLPKATTDATPEPPEQRSTKWRHKSNTGVTSGGRVNKTKGK